MGISTRTLHRPTQLCGPSLESVFRGSRRKRQQTSFIEWGFCAGKTFSGERSYRFNLHICAFDICRWKNTIVDECGLSESHEEWRLARTNRFPKNWRKSLGDRIDGTMLDLDSWCLCAFVREQIDSRQAATKGSSRLYVPETLSSIFMDWRIRQRGRRDGAGSWISRPMGQNATFRIRLTSPAETPIIIADWQKFPLVLFGSSRGWLERFSTAV